MDQSLEPERRRIRRRGEESSDQAVRVLPRRREGWEGPSNANIA